MLTSIKLKDYTTFIKETTFDFKATNYRILEDTNVGDNRILKGALFIGENASGKTQALQAIKLLLDLLFDNEEANYIFKKSLYTSGNKFSVTYVFCVDNKDIKYEITFKENTIFLEELYVDGELKLNRKEDEGMNYFVDSTPIKEINSKLSLLRFMYYSTKFYNDPLINKWFDYLKNSIYIYSPKGRVKGYNPEKAEEQSITKYAEKKDASALNKIIAKLKYNSEIIFDKTAISTEDEIFNKNLKINIRKNGTDVAIPLILESTGNKAFVNVILPIIFAVKNDCMIIIDEFSSGLHNELEEALVRFFYNNSKNSQLFFTSHSTNLIDTAILRPDQIFSFAFNSKEGTCIKRFSDENPRESQNMEKMYLNGVFDGMPEYDKEFRIK